jgi:copper oxidase (laccase) domain-containing protein
VRAFITTRAGGTSGGPYASFNLGLRTEDDPAAVAANRAALRSLLPQEPVWLRQVHGNRVVDADAWPTAPEVNADAPPARPEADAAIARNPERYARSSSPTACRYCWPIAQEARCRRARRLARAGGRRR